MTTIKTAHKIPEAGDIRRIQVSEIRQVVNASVQQFLDTLYVDGISF
jgi:hypothetical protein